MVSKPNLKNENRTYQNIIIRFNTLKNDRMIPCKNEKENQDP